MNYTKKIQFSLLSITTAILFTACNQSATSVLKKDPIYAQNLQYTKIGKIIENKEVKALVNITYLNSVEPKKYNNGKQNFLVGTYATNDFNAGYTLKMNGQVVENIQEVDIKSDMYKNIAFRNSWSKYQILTYTDTKDSTINLLYSDMNNNGATVSFEKE